jgi:hypothetical protein
MDYKFGNTCRTLWVLGLVLLIFAVAVPFATAQTQFGQLGGSVADPAGAVVPGAKVTVTNTATAQSQVVQTNNEGLFGVGNIAIGEYVISVEKEGFKRAEKRVKVEIAQSVFAPIALELGTTSETVEVSAQTTVVNTVNGEVSREVTGNEITNMPLLTRNPYNLVLLAPGAVDAGNASGDNYGVGAAVSGSRTRSMNFLLDGAENNETFSTGPSTLVPVDAIEEFKVQANSMTAEFGRNVVQANVVTKSGTNSFHGSASEFYRGAALSSMPIEEKANDIAKGNYVRNVFGAAVGGPIIKNKTFFFGAFEGTRVRSTGRNFYYVPTANFFNASSTATQDYLNHGGGLPTPALGDVITAQDLIANEWSANAFDAAGNSVPFPGYNVGPQTIPQATGNPPLVLQTALFPSGSMTAISRSTALWQRTFDTVPIDAGGGTAQNTWSLTGRVDHKISDTTNLSGRYAWYKQVYPTGASADSPYSRFNTPYSFQSQNGALVLTHSFSATLFNESRIAYSRTEPQSPLGKGDVNEMCLQYTASGSLGTGDAMVFPGYLPALCGAFAIPSGGPQNTYSAYTGFTYSHGRNIFKWGGYARHLRDNHTFGASQNANVQDSFTQNILNGTVDSLFSLAIDPRGLVPGDTYDPAVQGPLGPPSFTRHYRYNEVAFYFEDQIKIAPRFTLTAGLRWEYDGVLHSPSQEKYLDANLYLDAVGPAAALDPNKTIFDQIRDARFQRTGNFFNQDWNNFAPRLGFAWDVTGNQRTVLRGGYGLFYDANFGNALFNAIQNPPNYAVVNLTNTNASTSDPFGFIGTNQYTALGQTLGGGTFPISSSARMLNRNMVTAYSQEYNVTLEHDIMGKGLIATVGYVGSKGDKLYSLNNLNQRGSCIMIGQAWCDNGSIPARTRLNQTGLTGMNRRGNEGWSRYNSLQTELRTREIAHTGLQLAATYTWAHAIDNTSSFFNDSAYASYNGDFGFSNPYNPLSDKASGDNDVRNRFTMNYVWSVPWGRSASGWAGQVLGGWQLAGIYSAQSGVPISIFEDLGSFNDVCSASIGNSCYPIVTGPLPAQQQEKVSAGPNRSVLYDFSNSLESLAQYCNGDLACTQQAYFFPSNTPFLHRNQFHTPGYWNFDASLLKNFKLPKEGMALQFRAEFFNLFNHSNLYADPTTNSLLSGQLLARRGVPPSKETFGAPPDRRNIQLGLRLSF